MRRFFIVLLAVIVGIAGPWAYYEYIWRPTQPSAPTSVQVFFSPRGGCATAIIEAIRGAKKEVLIQAYGFTQKDIAMAAVEADRRGVPVRALLDKSNRTAKYSAADFMRNMGVAVWIDDSHAIAHNKVMIIDEETVITGSFNFTQAAEERNAENVLIIKDTRLASRYRENWEAHLGHAEEYLGRDPTPAAAQEAALQQASESADESKVAELATTEPTPRFFSITEGGRDGTAVHWGYSAESLMERAVASGERIVWVGDPENDAVNRREAASPLARERLVVQRPKDGLSLARWATSNHMAGINPRDGKVVWQGYPYAELEKLQADNVVPMSMLEVEAAQE